MTAAAMPPAVCRMIAPTPTPTTDVTARAKPAASTAPGTPGWERDTPRWLLDKIAWVRKKHARASSTPTVNAAAPVTAALAASTARRRGTAANVVRISPLAYSEVNTSTLKTVTGSTVYSAKPRKLPASGSIGLRWPEAGADAKLCATIAVTPSVTTAAMSSVQPFERTDRSLVHSKVSTSRARTGHDGTAAPGVPGAPAAPGVPGAPAAPAAGIWDVVIGPLLLPVP